MNYKYRVHDPRLGRFMSVDPLAPEYPHWSPYSFSGNMVIHTTELEGLEPVSDPNEYSKFLARDGGEDLSIFEEGSSSQYRTDASSSVPGVAVPTPGSPGVRATPGNPPPGPGTGNRPVSPGPGARIPRLLVGASPVLVGVGTAASIIYGGQLNPNPFHASIPRDDSNADVDQPEKDDYITLYRGVHSRHPDLLNAKMGMAVPRNLESGHSDPELHNAGGNESIFTSWTWARTVANYHANKRGAGGVVLTKKFRRSETIPTSDAFLEGEILIIGIVTGADVAPPNSPGSPSIFD